MRACASICHGASPSNCDRVAPPPSVAFTLAGHAGRGGWVTSPHAPPAAPQDFCLCGMDWPSATSLSLCHGLSPLCVELLCLAHVSCVVGGGVVRREHALARVTGRLGTRTECRGYALLRWPQRRARTAAPAQPVITRRGKR